MRGNPDSQGAMLIDIRLKELEPQAQSLRSLCALVNAFNYCLLYLWSVGLNIEDMVWEHFTYRANHEPLFNEGLADASFWGVLLSAQCGMLASGTAKHEAVLPMLKRRDCSALQTTAGTDNGTVLVDTCHKLEVISCVAFNNKHSAVSGHVKRHKGYTTSLKAHKRIKEAVGWIKTSGGLVKTKRICRIKLTAQALLCFATYDLACMSRHDPNLA